jgi:tetratricopeptide (TPR) repeat protein
MMVFRLSESGFWAFAIVLFALPAWAQKGGAPPHGGGAGGPRGTPGGGIPGGGAPRTSPPPIQPGTQPYPYPDAGVYYPTPGPEPMKKPVVVQEDACLPWDLSQGSGATVSAVRLSVPSKARSQYDKACGAFKKNKFTEAEQHTRDAIEKYPNYPAAWVMLGQVLQGEGKADEARDACSKPLTVDRTYLPPYLCLAGLLDREKRWDDLLTLCDRFGGMSPSGDVYAYYYRGLAQLHLQKLPEAQKNAQRAIELDSQHHQPGFNFLLALIYERMGDVANATLQAQQFLKYTSNPAEKEQAKQYLSELQSQQNTK